MRVSVWVMEEKNKSASALAESCSSLSMLQRSWQVEGHILKEASTKQQSLFRNKLPALLVQYFTTSNRRYVSWGSLGLTDFLASHKLQLRYSNSLYLYLYIVWRQLPEKARFFLLCINVLRFGLKTQAVALPANSAACTVVAVCRSDLESGEIFHKKLLRKHATLPSRGYQYNTIPSQNTCTGKPN